MIPKTHSTKAKLFTFSLIGVLVPSFVLISANLYFNAFKNFWCANDFVAGLISWTDSENDTFDEKIYPSSSEISCLTKLHDHFFKVEKDNRKYDNLENRKGLVTRVTPILDWKKEELPVVSQDKRQEALHSLKAALILKARGKLAKAKRVLEHAHSLDPISSDILTELGELVEKRDVLLAEYYYHKAVTYSPSHHKALELQANVFPIVQDIDQGSIRRVDSKLNAFYKLPDNTSDLLNIRRNQYFSHIYHSNAIEGNTLTLSQTRSILETRISIGGKSLLEQNEVLGLDAALKYINSSILRVAKPITLQNILEIHRRVLGYVDLSEAGHLRQTQVYIANHTPPPAHELPRLMNDFVAWLNSPEVKKLHAIERAALAHWYLVNIHPFYDGNGRTARLLTNVILMRAGYPPAIIKVEDRAQYFEYIQRANEGDVRWFIRFIVRATEVSLDEYLQCVSNSSSTANDHLSNEKIASNTFTNVSAMSASIKRNCNVNENEETTSMQSPPRVIYLEGL